LLRHSLSDVLFQRLSGASSALGRGLGAVVADRRKEYHWVDNLGTRCKKHCSLVQIDSVTILPLLKFLTFLSIPYSPSLVLTLTLVISVPALIVSLLSQTVLSLHSSIFS